MGFEINQEESNHAACNPRKYPWRYNKFEKHLVMVSVSHLLNSPPVSIISLTQSESTLMSLYTPNLLGSPHPTPHETIPVRNQTPRSWQANGPPLSNWHGPTPPSAGPAQRALSCMMPSYISGILHNSLETRGTLASRRIDGCGPLEASLPQPVTWHAVPGIKLAPLGSRQIGNEQFVNGKVCFKRTMAVKKGNFNEDYYIHMEGEAWKQRR